MTETKTKVYCTTIYAGVTTVSSYVRLNKQLAGDFSFLYDEPSTSGGAGPWEDTTTSGSTR